MPNSTLFSGLKKRVARATTKNRAGGPAFALPPRHALAQLAATGCFHGTYYAGASDQLDQLRLLVDQVDDNEFLAKLAVYARERAFMKDMPAALLLTLFRRDTQLGHRVFPRVVDNGRVLRTLLQMVRSGQFGCSGLSSSLQRAFQRWLNDASVGKLLSASIGHDPSLRDVLRLARPRPTDNSRRALYGWLTDKPVEKWAPATAADLPDLVQLLQKYRATNTDKAQAEVVVDLSVRWDLLADAARGTSTWKAIALQMGPQALRMNLNTLLRHGVFCQDDSSRQDRSMIDAVASRLADPAAIRRSRQFPYHFLSAYLNADTSLPQKVRSALQQAAEVACGNIPEFPGPVVIGVDASGSMQCPVTGYQRRGAVSKVRCVDVAALFAAAVLRRNPDSVVIPYDTRAYDHQLDADDSILSVAKRLASYGGGGTDCSVPLQVANERFAGRAFAGVILISDNESWVYRNRPAGWGSRGSTGVLNEWHTFVKNQRKLRGAEQPAPKLVCIDLQPYGTTQAPDRADILNIGGFSDSVFGVVSGFLGNDPDGFVAEVEAVEL